MTKPRWMRFSPFTSFCAITRAADGIALSECKRTFASDDLDTFGGEPPRADLCDCCCRVLVDRRLRELDVDGAEWGGAA